MPPFQRLLSIEDNPVDAFLIRATFETLARRRPAAAFEVSQAASLSEGLELLEQHEFGVILLDLSLPDTTGLQAVARLAAARPEVPILVLTSQDDEELALRALQAGAQDYLVKGRFDTTLLDRVVLHAIERQRLASALGRAHSRELERRDEFLSHVSHELRTPLSAIEQFSSILSDGLAGALDEQQGECVDVLRRNAKQLRRMVDDLIEVTRADSGQLALRPAPTDLAAIMKQTVATFAARLEDRGLRLVTRLEDTRAASADPMRISQVIANLLDNAIKFTPRGGELSVSLSDGPEVIQVTVADTGCGVPRAELPAIFDRLHQAPSSPDEASRRGLGLGLFICRQIVDLHGGWIWAESREGSGSAFHFTVPVWSLERLLDPLLVRGHGHDEPFHLVRVSLAARGAGDVPLRALRALDDVVRRCAAEQAGALLPAAENAPQRLFVTRGTGPMVRALVKRLRRRLARQPALDASTTRVRVGRRVLLAAVRGGRRRVLDELTRRLTAEDPALADSFQRLQAKGTSSTSTL